jgi:hypothetical protein
MEIKYDNLPMEGTMDIFSTLHKGLVFSANQTWLDCDDTVGDNGNGLNLCILDHVASHEYL